MPVILSVIENMTSITPTRSFNLAYIILDSVFILFLLFLLIIKKRYQTLLFAVFGGILYLIVDYGMFYALSHTREIYFLINGEWELQGSLNTFLILTWMSLSYGITNFAFIWLALRKDKYLMHFSLLIFGWWLVAPSLSKFGGDATILTQRTTNEYHYIMAIILVIGYGALIAYSMIKEKKVYNLLLLNVIGISIQFAWEFALLINGIRPFNEMSIKTLIVNSCIETNLGMPYIYLIFVLINKKFNEDLSKVKA